jgi:hypothetical protein
MAEQATAVAGPSPGRRKNQAFGVISERLRRFYSELEAIVDPNTEDFFQRVMRQSEQQHRPPAAGGKPRGISSSMS